MDLLAKTLNYWQQAWQQHQLFALDNYTLDNTTIFIRKAELLKGCLPEPIAGLTHALVIPVFARNHSKIFIPCMLEVTIDERGYFTPSKQNSLPIIPRSVLEPSPLNPLLLGVRETFDDFYNIYPPTWQSVGYDADWNEQLSYADNLLGQQCQSLWLEQLNECGYVLDDEFALVVPLKALCQEVKLHNDLIERLYAAEDNALLTVSNLEELKLAAIYAKRGSGKSKFIAASILKDWMESIINDTLPPLHVWLPYESTKITRYTNIFDCYNENEVWLTADIRCEIIAPHIFSDFSLSYCLQNFLSLLSDHFQQDIVHLNQAKDILKNKLQENYLPYLKGCSLLKSWHDLEAFTKLKYQNRGGIHTRIRALKQALAEVQQELRYILVIAAVWQRQLQDVNKLPQWFNVIAPLNYLKNNKLYKFYTQYFPDDQISMLSIKALDAKLQGKISKLQGKERLLNDTLHQCNNELLQLDAIRLNCKTWFRDHYQYNLTDYIDASSFLNTQVMQHLNFITLKYYESVVLEDFAWSKTNGLYAPYFIDNEVMTIDTLFIEHSNYLPTIQVLPCLAKASKAVIFGNEYCLAMPLIPMSVDLALCRAHGLLTQEQNLTNYALSGVLASTGNLWQLLTKDKKVPHILGALNYKKPTIEYIKERYHSEEYLGSRCNLKELALLHQALLDIYERAESLHDVIIYTTCAGQLAKIVLLLQNTIFAHLSVKLIQEPCLRRARISILSVVFGPNDGIIASLETLPAILDNLLNNTAEKLLVIGDDYQFLRRRAATQEAVNMLLV